MFQREGRKDLFLLNKKKHIYSVSRVDRTEHNAQAAYTTASVLLIRFGLSVWRLAAAESLSPWVPSLTLHVLVQIAVVKLTLPAR